MRFFKPKAIAAVAVLAVAGAAGAHAADKNYTLGSLAEGTTPFLVNTAFANAVNRYVPGHRIQVSAVGPATRHMLLTTQRKMDFTMSSSSAYRLLYFEIGPFKKLKDGAERVKLLNILFTYPIGFYHPVVYAESGMKTFKDIKGKTVFMGPPAGVATRNVALIIDAMTGYVPGRDFEQVKLGWGPAQQAFQDRKFDVWITTTMPPSPAVSQLALTNKIRLLELDESRFDHPSWKRYMGQPGRAWKRIDPKVYGKNMVNERPVLSTGAFVGMCVRSDMEAEVVYQMMKAFWEHIDEAHALGKSMPGVLNFKNAVADLHHDVHPGALRYYKEKGIEVPKPYSLTLADREAFRAKVKSKN